MQHVIRHIDSLDTRELEILASLVHPDEGSLKHLRAPRGAPDVVLAESLYQTHRAVGSGPRTIEQRIIEGQPTKELLRSVVLRTYLRFAFAFGGCLPFSNPKRVAAIVRGMALGNLSKQATLLRGSEGMKNTVASAACVYLFIAKCSGILKDATRKAHDVTYTGALSQVNCLHTMLSKKTVFDFMPEEIVASKTTLVENMANGFVCTSLLTDFPTASPSLYFVNCFGVPKCLGSALGCDTIASSVRTVVGLKRGKRAAIVVWELSDDASPVIVTAVVMPLSEAGRNWVDCTHDEDGNLIVAVGSRNPIQDVLNDASSAVLPLASVDVMRLKGDALVGIPDAEAVFERHFCNVMDGRVASANLVKPMRTVVIGGNSPIPLMVIPGCVSVGVWGRCAGGLANFDCITCMPNLWLRTLEDGSQTTIRVRADFVITSAAPITVAPSTEVPDMDLYPVTYDM
jgi:hypothetical protein